MNHSLPACSQHDAAVLSSESFRGLMQTFASSVSVITAAHEGRLYGLTVTTATSVSAEPPSMLIMVNRSSRSYQAIAASNSFAINVLAEGQEEIGTVFASKSEDKFSGLDYKFGVTGSPVLKGASAHLECRIVTSFEYATHSIFIGQVVAGQAGSLFPLLYHGRAYASLQRQK